MRLWSVLLSSSLWAASLSVAGAATPAPSQSAVATNTPVVTETVTPGPSRSVVATGTPMVGTPTMVASPSPTPAKFTLSGRLVVDANGTGVEDAGDAAPKLAYLVVVPWSTADQILAPTPVVPPSVALYSAADGSFRFENLPVGSYELAIYWPFGFETKGASPAVPANLRAAFRVTDKGEIVAPAPLPQYWPGSLVPFNPDEPILGPLPNPILLKKIDNPNMVTVPVFDAGAAGPPPVGRVDVAAALQRQRQAAPQLPSAGLASERDGAWRTYLLLGVASVALFGLAALVVRRART